MQKLKIGDKEFEVVSVYPYRYDSGRGKEVLRFDVLESISSFDVLKNTFTNTGNLPIQQYENGELKCEYTGYCGEFTCNYNGGKYEVEVTRKGVTDLEIDRNKEDIANTSAVVDELSVQLADLMFS